MSVYYKEYLALDKILDAQHPMTFKEGQQPAHDEMLFIVIHQSYELWFKQIKFEVDAVLKIMNKEVVNDNTSELSIIVHRLKRVGIILKMLVGQIDVLETMSPMEFLSFRDSVRPASGFQSWQFKEIEAALGLKYDHRYGQEFYTSALKKEELDIIKNAEASRSLLQDVNDWLERMPFINDENYWLNYQPVSGNHTSPKFWNDYEHIFLKSLPEYDSSMKIFFNRVFSNDPTDGERQLSATACRSALFIILYREYPLMELPFQLLDTLLEIDNQLGNWRYRHINMVKRMIGARSGTGGSSGMDYLKAAADKHNIFKEVAQLNSFLIDKRKLPALPPELEEKLRYKS
ncbi:MAG: tryptophan 2,3-dioxygenase [Chitinophagaceae bacterium]|nr:tryptophan 2,3-dioxygenase [Chitinophagaceae bacterium]